MGAVLTTPKVATGTGLYRIGGNDFYDVRKTMPLIEQARDECGSDEPVALLRLAIELARARPNRAGAIKDLYAYGRFQFAIPVDVLNNLFGNFAKDGVSLREIGMICNKVGIFWERKGTKDKRTITTR